MLLLLRSLFSPTTRRMWINFLNWKLSTPPPFHAISSTSCATIKMALQGLREMENLLLQLLLTSESSANNSDAEFFPASLRKLNMCPIAQSFRKDENNDDQIFLNWFTQSTNWLSNTSPWCHCHLNRSALKKTKKTPSLMPIKRNLFKFDWSPLMT